MILILNFLAEIRLRTAVNAWHAEMLKIMYPVVHGTLFLIYSFLYKQLKAYNTKDADTARTRQSYFIVILYLWEEIEERCV